MIALVGIPPTRAFGPLTSIAASAAVMRYPIYWHVSAPVFWEVTSASASLLAGFVPSEGSGVGVSPKPTHDFAVVNERVVRHLRPCRIPHDRFMPA
jgi:hypothetical protein